jgi:hypothetical protein
MKAIRQAFVGLTVSCVLAFGLMFSLPAQDQKSPPDMPGNSLIAAPPQAKAEQKRAALLKQLELERQKPRIKQPKPPQASSGHGTAFYSAQRPWLPPLPFSPLPNKTIYNVGIGKFIYDDLDVDYTKIVNTAPEISLSFSAASTSTQTAQAQAAGSPTSLRLSIIRTNDGFHLGATNLVPGRAYVLSDKGSFQNDFTANWQPSLVFTASTASVTLTGSFLDDQSYYLLWDYDLYNGPVIRMDSPLPGSTVSGKTVVSGSVADLLPDRVAELYVDNDFYRDITNGPLRFELDTRQFINGPHQITVVVRSQPFSDGFEASSSVSAEVNFSNAFSIVNLPPFFSGAPTFDFNTTVPASYRLDVTSASGQPIRTITGDKLAGPGQVYWDMNDNNGQPVASGEGYNFDLQTGRGLWNDEWQTPFRWTANTSLNNDLLPIIQRRDVGHVFCKGHGSGSAIGTGADSVVIDPLTVADIMRSLTNHSQNTAFTFRTKTWPGTTWTRSSRSQEPCSTPSLREITSSTPTNLPSTARAT